MGMFDTYRPAADLRCPECGRPLRRWQGKDGPCGLYVWVEGRAAPLAQDVDEDIALLVADRSALRLPDTFTIYSYDCEQHAPTEARCSCADGVWVQTTLLPTGA